MSMLSATYPSEAHPRAVPARLDHRYQILAFLSQGGQAAVYEAQDRLTNTRVALKLIDSYRDSEPEAHSYLMKEAQIGRRLACEHIVHILDAGTDPETGVSYLSMELLQGTDLEQLVTRSGPLAAADVTEYLRQAAVGLDYAHGCPNSGHAAPPIVHRDLKPANLFLTRRADGSPLLKILDFGVAKVLESNTIPSVALRGTPLYMSAEQVAGVSVTPAADIWALGLIAFFLLTGKRYWDAGQLTSCNLPSLLREISAGASEPPSRRAIGLGYGRRLPPQFDEWFLRCVHRNPERRFSTAGQAIDALAVALRSPVEPLTSGEASRIMEVGRRQAAAGRRELAIPNAHRLLWLILGAVIGFAAVVCCGAMAVVR
jgi:serine/threonine protein kinase